MTYTTTKDVPRESFRRRVVGWLALTNKAFWEKRRAAYQAQHPTLPNHRLIELSPYLLRDVGLRDAHAPPRRK